MAVAPETSPRGLNRNRLAPVREANRGSRVAAKAPGLGVWIGSWEIGLAPDNN